MNLAKMQLSLWAGSTRRRLKGPVIPLINHCLPSASLRPAPELVPTPTNRLAAEKFHKKGFIARLQERRFINRRHGMPSSSRGQARQPPHIPNPSTRPLEAIFPLGPRLPRHGDPRRTSGIRSLRWHQSYLLNLVTYPRRKLRL